jgi:hypothetical protein
MNVRNVMIRALVVGAVVLFAGIANAGPIATFGFTELNGDWNGINQFFADDGVATSGDVTRILPVTQTALYQPGFAGPAGYQMTMTLSSINVPPGTAVGTGSLIVRDANGDTLTANIGGSWIQNGPFGFFNGLLSQVMFNETGDGIFQGPSGGAFSMDFSNVAPPEPYDGAIMTLTTGSWFNLGTPFSDESTLVHASILPEPASIALAVFGLISTTFRRRT